MRIGITAGKLPQRRLAAFVFEKAKRADHRQPNQRSVIVERPKQRGDGAPVAQETERIGGA